MENVGEHRGTPFPSESTIGDTGVYAALLAARAGDSEAVARLVASATRHLRRLVDRRLSTGWVEAWADDVVQSALLRVLKSHLKCRATCEEEAIGWVLAIGRSEIAELFRTPNPPTCDVLRMSDQIEDRANLWEERGVRRTDPDPSPAIAALLRALKAATDHLSPDQHRLLCGRLVEELTWSELGRELDISSSTAVKRRYQRLIARLARALRYAAPL